MSNSRRVRDEVGGRPKLGVRADAGISGEQRVYQPDGDTLVDFLTDRSLVSILMGPLGSAKTIALLHKIMILCAEAWPSPDGLRRSRVFIVRNTYSDLRTTTMAKWTEWFPEEEYGRIKMEKPPMLMLRQGDVEAEIWFLALDQQDDIRKLRSLEPSIVAFNELQYVEKEIFDEATSRVGRYPADVPHELRTKAVLADMNAPEETHWTAVMFGLVEPDWLTVEERDRMVKPAGWALFEQPPAVLSVMGADGKTVSGFRVNPNAENLKYLGEDYYRQMLSGKTNDWIYNRLMVRVGTVTDGSVVWPMFQPDTHCSKQKLAFNPHASLDVGVDFGRKPAAIFGQAYNNRCYLLGECVREGMSAEVYAPILKREIAQRFPEATKVRLWGDPSGDFQGQTDERTPFDIFKAHGLPIIKAPTNDLGIRLDAVVKVLSEMESGVPRFVMDSRGCPVLKAGMSGGYKYEKVKGKDREHAEPSKNRYSHPADALQYLFLGWGEGRKLIRGGREVPQPVQTALYRRGNVIQAGRRFARG